MVAAADVVVAVVAPGRSPVCRGRVGLCAGMCVDVRVGGAGRHVLMWVDACARDAASVRISE